MLFRNEPNFSRLFICCPHPPVNNFNIGEIRCVGAPCGSLFVSLADIIWSHCNHNANLSDAFFNRCFAITTISTVPTLTHIAYFKLGRVEVMFAILSF